MHLVTGRFAPSPSGPLHLGNLACCLIAYLSARRAGGRFLLRIEDLDTRRCTRHAGEAAIEDLRLFGFDWDGEVVFQSDRTPLYARGMDLLGDAGVLYPCFCTRSELLAASAPNLGDTQSVYPGTCARLTPEQVAQKLLVRNPAMRVRVPDRSVTFTDRVFGPFTENLQRDCGDFIVRRSDGLFGYQLAVVMDDAAQGVTEVVRGRDILSATPRQIYLASLLGSPVPAYAHIPLLLAPDGRRLAKRDRDLGIRTLLGRFSPEFITGCLAFAYGLLDRPVAVSLRELVSLFDWQKVKREDVRLPSLLLGP